MRRFWLAEPISYLPLLIVAMTFSAVSAAQVQCLRAHHASPPRGALSDRSVS